MAKTKISEFSSTPANNTDIDSINIAEGCAPSGINDAIRELMAQLKDFQTGAVGDSFNGPIGTSTAAAGAFTTLSATGAITSTLATGTAPLVIASTTKVANLNVDLLDGADWASPAALGSTTPAAVSATTLSASSTVTLSGGTANGVAYLNGSKVVTSGSALTFDGTSFGLSGTGSRFINLGSTSTNGQSVALQISAPNSDASANVYRVGTGLTADNEWVVYDVTNTQTVDKYIRGSSGYRAFYQNGSEAMRLTSTGLGIGTSSPAAKLNVNGNALFNGTTKITSNAVEIQGDMALGNYSSYSTSNYRDILYSASTASFGNQPTAYIRFQTTSDIGSAILFATRSSAGDYAERLRLDQSGNLGLGVTPSAWDTAYLAMQFPYGGSLSGYKGSPAPILNLSSNVYYNSGNKYVITAAATQYSQNQGVHSWYIAPSGTAGNAITFTQAMSLTAAGDLLVGTTTNTSGLRILASDGTVSTGFLPASTIAYTGTWTNHAFGFATNGTEKARIDSSGNLLVGTTSADPVSTNAVGISFEGAFGSGKFSRSNNAALDVNRITNDGELVRFYQDGTQEGNISVSGTTVSYNGGHLSRYAQTTTAKDDSLLKGTVLSNLDEMSVYTKDGQPVANEQLNKVKVSDTEGDANVAGVFVNWSHDEVHNVDEINMAMTGDMIIRIAQGTTVVRGDLLMSAGNGTAKPQGDDIVRSKTIAKVTSNHVTCTYADGSYCVPCVLMAC